MTNLQDLPELPKSLSALLTLGNAQWKETERLHQMRREIQEDLSRSQLMNEIDNGRKWNQNLRMPTPNRLDAQITRLRRDMVSLRQLDASLLCQLMSLNEAILDFKNSMQRDRIPSETISEMSEGSFPSFDHGLDGILDFGEDGDLLESVFSATDSLTEFSSRKQHVLNSPKRVRWKTSFKKSEC